MIFIKISQLNCYAVLELPWITKNVYCVDGVASKRFVVRRMDHGSIGDSRALHAAQVHAGHWARPLDYIARACFWLASTLIGIGSRFLLLCWGAFGALKRVYMCSFCIGQRMRNLYILSMCLSSLLSI